MQAIRADLSITGEIGIFGQEAACKERREYTRVLVRSVTRMINSYGRHADDGISYTQDVLSTYVTDPNKILYTKGYNTVFLHNTPKQKKNTKNNII